MENKRISQFETTYATDNTSWIPLAQGTPYRNRKIKANTFIQDIIDKVLNNDSVITRPEFERRVQTDVPANAIFTDTVYKHPSTHPASMITESSTKRFVSDAEKNNWNSKETPEGALAKSNAALASAKSYVDSTIKTSVPEGAVFTDTITTINGKTGVITKEDILALGIKEGGGDTEGLASIEYVDDRVKTPVPIGAKFTDTIVDISGKVDKIEGEGLISDEEKLRLSTVTNQDISDLATKAEVATKASKTYVDEKVKTDVPEDAVFTDTVTDTSNLATKDELLSKADKSYVDGKVKTDVPENAKFTDTIIDISGKVDKVEGKSLIANEEIIRLEGVANQTLEGLGGEPTANKETVVTSTSDVLFPTSRAVAQYVQGNTPKYPNVEMNIIESLLSYDRLPPLKIGENFLAESLDSINSLDIWLPETVDGRFNEIVFHFFTSNISTLEIQIYTSEGYDVTSKIIWLDQMDLVIKPNKFYTVIFEWFKFDEPGYYIETLKGSWGEYAKT